MIESKGTINPITQEEISKLVEDNGSELSNIVTYPYCTNEIYRENATWLYNYGISTMIISESNFNHAFQTTIDVKKDELLIVSNEVEDFEETKIDFDTFLVLDSAERGEDRASEIRELRPTRDEFYSVMDRDNVICLTYDSEKTSAMYYPFINSYGNMEFAAVIANIIDDEVYNSLVNPEITDVYLFDIAKGNHLEIYSEILDYMRMKNNNVNLWDDLSSYHELKTTAESLPPICKEFSIEQTLKVMGMFSFTMTFISILFLISASFVMYYKIVNDITYEKEQFQLFQKIGLTRVECIRYLYKHTAVLFFTPLLFGGVIGLFYNYFFFYNIPNRNYLLMVVLIMFLCFVIYDVIFYILVRKNLVKKIGIL